MTNKIPSVYTAKSPKVYKHNKLNNANFSNFSLIDYQVFCNLITKLHGVDNSGRYLLHSELEREHMLTAKEFSKIFRTDLHNSYRYLKKAVDKLMKTDIKLEMYETNELWRINVCSMAKYNEKEGYISIQFTDSIMPYLAQVSRRFVLYNLEEISNFRSLYSTRLYELTQEFKQTGWIIKSLDQLRDLFAVGQKYKNYAHFKARILEPACNEINSFCDLGVYFKEIKEGKKVTAIKFYFSPVEVIQEINPKTNRKRNRYVARQPKNIDSNKVEKNKNDGFLSSIFERIFGSTFTKK